MKLTTCLWFDGNAYEAAKFYVESFPDSHFESDEPNNDFTVSFTIFGQQFIGLNGGPHFQFSEAISFQIPCADQSEIDHYWELLTRDGGEPGRCGWLKDKFGVSWQVVSPTMGEYLGGSNASGREAAINSMMAMSKIDLAELQSAYDFGAKK